MSTYSKKTQGNQYLSANFQVKEFACKDGSDTVLIDTALVKRLQAIRGRFGKPVTINSAYRTAAHNKKVGGASNSQHIYGRAADIVVSGVSPAEVAKYAESIGILGIGRYAGFTHIDTRTSKSFWRNDGKGDYAVSTHGAAPVNPYPVPSGNLKSGSRGEDVKWLQWALNQKGFNCGTVDGIWGAKTETAVKAFQKSKGLAVDGIVGQKTKAALGV